VAKKSQIGEKGQINPNVGNKNVPDNEQSNGHKYYKGKKIPNEIEKNSILIIRNINLQKELSILGLKQQ
jgi:hypothetical protein